MSPSTLAAAAVGPAAAVAKVVGGEAETTAAGLAASNALSLTNGPVWEADSAVALVIVGQLRSFMESKVSPTAAAGRCCCRGCCCCCCC